MILDNRSSRPDEEIRELCRFVVQFFKHHKDCTVTVYDEEGYDAGQVGHGVYYGWTNKAEVYIPRFTSYPIAAQHRKRTGGTVYRCWQDVFVAILAHELRHCDQRWSTDKSWAHHPHYEVDAEFFAQKVLAQRRNLIDPVDNAVRV